MSEPASQPMRRIRITDFLAAKRAASGGRCSPATTSTRPRSSTRPASGRCWSATRPPTTSTATRPPCRSPSTSCCRWSGRWSASTQRAFVVGDLPFGSYEEGPSQALRTAIRFMKEGGCHAVKFEGGVRVADQIRKVTEAGIPVMGHIGFTPQSEHQLGGYRVQGRGDGGEAAARGRARGGRGRRVRAWCWRWCPGDLARQVSPPSCDIPTVGIGAGPDCDAQVLVWQDVLGLRQGTMPRFVKQYANLAEVDRRRRRRPTSTRSRGGAFPTAEHTFAGDGPAAAGRAHEVAPQPSAADDHRTRVWTQIDLDAAPAAVRPERGYVPTMGALHDGHRSLIGMARALRRRRRRQHLRQPAAVRPGRGLRPLSAAARERPGELREPRRRRRLRPERSPTCTRPAARSRVSAGAMGTDARGRVAARALRRRADRGAQAAQHRPAATWRSSARRTLSSWPASSGWSSTSTSPVRDRRRRRSSASRTAWPCPAATSFSARPSGRLALQPRPPRWRRRPPRPRSPSRGWPRARCCDRAADDPAFALDYATAGQPGHLRRAAGRLHRARRCSSWRPGWAAPG